MNEASATRLWLMRAGYLAVGMAVMFFQLLPLQTVPRHFAGPDLLLAFTLAWAVRRPEYVPVLSIAIVALLSDFLLQRPPGLWAALVVLVAGAVKRRSVGLRDQTFAVEWLKVSIAVIGVILVNRFVLSTLLIPQAPLGLASIQTLMTIATYPLVALITVFAFGVKSVQPGEAEPLGGRA
ncbi:MAG: rod shape-determining protein MreD [Thalassovita sp.]